MRFTFSETTKEVGTFSSGNVLHQIESVTRVDNQDQSSQVITMTTCGQSSPTYRAASYIVYKDKEVTCKKCLKHINKYQGESK